MTFKEAKSHIEKKFRRSLNKAPFDPNDADLVPASIEREAPGACPKCPYRIAPNVCTNTPCFERKAQMAAAARAEKFVKQGRTVLTEKPAELFHENWNSGGKGTLKHGAGYIQASETCWEDPKHRSYKELLGKKVEPVVAFDQGGHPHELYPGKGMAEMLRTAGHEFREDKKAEKKKAKAQEDLGRLVNQELLKDMLHLVEQDKFEKAFLTCLLRDREGRSFILEKVFKLRGEPEYDTDDPKWWQGLTVKQLRSYLLETTLRAGDYDNSLDDAELWADDFGIKKHLVKDRVQVRLKAEAKAAADAKKGKDRKAGGTPALPGKAKK
jgi:hypothetical protein